MLLELKIHIFTLNLPIKCWFLFLFFIEIEGKASACHKITQRFTEKLMKLKLQGLLLVKVSFEAHGRGLGHLFNLARYFVKFAKIWYSKHSRLQLLLSFTPHQDSMVLAQKQKYRPMEQHRKLRDKPMHLWAAYLWQRRQEHAMEKRQPLQ